MGRLLHYSGLLMAVVCDAVAYELVVMPAKEKLGKQEMRINELRELLKNGPSAQRQHKQLSERIAAVQDRITALQLRVPEGPDEALFLKQVSEIAEQEDFTVSNFRPQKPLAREGYSEVQIAITGGGSYASICKFLDQLASSQRLAKVKDLEIRTGATKGSYPLEATLVIYFGLSREPATGQEVRRG